MNIASRLELITETRPDKSAFIFFSGIQSRSNNYRTQSHRLARGPQACRAETSMRAALMTPPSADFFALLKLGDVPIIPRPCPRI